MPAAAATRRRRSRILSSVSVCDASVPPTTNVLAAGRSQFAGQREASALFQCSVSSAKDVQANTKQNFVNSLIERCLALEPNTGLTNSFGVS